MPDLIASELADGILTIRFNRPDKKNAITVAMYSALADALDRAAEDKAVRVVVITGTADSFTSGNDVADFLQRPPSDGESPVFRFLRMISTAPKPLVAAVNGLAVGVGVTMLLHCDLVYAAENATFALPFVNLGVVPEAASTLLLPRLAGHQRAAELFLFGDKFDAKTAHEVGIVNAIFPAADFSGSVRERALALAAKPPASLRLTKALLKSNTATVPERMAEEGAHFTAQLKSPEAREAMEAFLQRRKPDFSRFD
jgi:enoyl-CoA hydratase/carnithine racemase